MFGKKPELILQKTADKEKHRIMLPIKFARKHGRYFYMEVYDDYIILKPVKEKESK